jgi:hypothetical protein
MGGLELQRLSGHTAEQAETPNIDLPERRGAYLDQPRYSMAVRSMRGSPEG